MGKTTQDGRQLTISTPLGKDFFLINRLSMTEGLSELYTIRVELWHEETSFSYQPTNVDIKSILGQAVSITVKQEDGSGRNFSGIVAEFSQGNRDTHYSYYYATIVPNVWLLTQNIQSKIYQHKSVPDILREVLSGFEVEYSIQGDFQPRNYCVQYRESDFDFISRLMEEEGIYYYFDFSDDRQKMVIANTSQSHKDCPNKNEIPFLTLDDVMLHQTHIATWHTEQRLQTGKITLWDHNFQLPQQRFEFSQPSLYKSSANQQLEIYDYPGGYSRKYDGIDKSGGERAGDLQKIYNDREKTAKNRMDALDAQYKVINGTSNCSSFTAGHSFSISTHPNKELNGKYVLTSVSHQAEQTPTYRGDTKVTNAYEATFTCIPLGSGAATFRPMLKTPKPTVQGSQTALVVGPAGEEIFTDKYGRVKVQFYWDRYGKVDSDSSCWVRVSQAWAGKQWGAMFIPRIGMEVIVHFVDGDPDKPIITGCVYNADSMPPYTLPDEKTKSTLKSNSSKGGGGFNEFRIEDKKGSEQIFLHGEKDLDIRIKNDAKELIKHDRHLIVENSQFEKVKADKHLEVTGNHNEKIGGSMSLTIGGDLQEKVQTKFAVDAGMEVHIKSGMTMTLETGTNLTLKVGGNFININPGGIFIKGTMVMLNSGGMAGSGGGCSPTSPTAPKEADDATAGSVNAKMASPPPTTPATYSAKAQALQNAAQSGTPLVANSSNSPAPQNSGGANNQSSNSPNANNPSANNASEAAKKAEAAKEKAQNKANELKDKAKQKIDEAKKKAEEIKSKAEAIKEKAKKAIDSMKEKAVQAAKDKVRDLTKNEDVIKAADKAIDKAADEAEEKVKEEVKEAKEKIKEKIEDVKKEAQEAVEEKVKDLLD